MESYGPYKIHPGGGIKKANLLDYSAMQFIDRLASSTDE